MPDVPSIRPAHPGDTEALLALRLEALAAHPEAFLESVAEAEARGPMDLKDGRDGGPRHAIFLAEGEGGLLGMCGLAQDRSAKARHRATVWGVYVRPSSRRHQLGRALLEAALALAETWPGVRQVHLGVGTHNAPALALYQSVGFQTWGIEPGTMRISDRDVDEAHMVLHLAARDPGTGGAG